MAHRTRSHTRGQVEHLRRASAQADGLPFAGVLPADRVERAIREEYPGWRAGTFTPAVTLWAFLTQVLTPAACCRAAVGRVMAWLVARGERPCGPGTGGYGKARGRPPERVVVRLMRETGRALHDAAPDRWRGRPVLIADGTGVSMPDSPAERRRPGLVPFTLTMKRGTVHYPDVKGGPMYVRCTGAVFITCCQ